MRRQGRRLMGPGMGSQGGRREVGGAGEGVQGSKTSGPGGSWLGWGWPRRGGALCQRLPWGGGAWGLRVKRWMKRWTSEAGRQREGWGAEGAHPEPSSHPLPSGELHVQ